MKPIETTLVFCVRKNRVLLAMKKRGFGAGKWNGPGGKVDPGETHEQAMIRECEEEISVTPIGYTHVATLDFYEAFNGKPEHVITYVYICTAWKSEPQESEEMTPRWFNADAVPYEEMWPDDKHWLPLVLAGKKLRAEFHFAPDFTIEKQVIMELEELPNV